MSFTVGLVFGGKGAEAGVNIRAAKDFARVLEHYECQVRYIDINKLDAAVQQVSGSDVCVGIEKTALNQEFINSFNQALEQASVEYIGQSDQTRITLRDKFSFAASLTQAGVKTPQGIRVQPAGMDGHDVDASEYLSHASFPIIVKPNGGSLSEGVTFVENMTAANQAIQRAAQKGDAFLIQEYLPGQEVTCPVVRMMGVNVMGRPMEITYTGAIYDFKTKNVTLRNGLIIPPRNWSEDLQAKMAGTLEKAAKISGTNFAIRLDTKVHQDNITVLEGNAEPSLSKNDFVSRSFKAAGFSYPELVLGLLSNSERFSDFAAKSRKTAKKIDVVRRKLSEYRV